MLAAFQVSHVALGLEHASEGLSAIPRLIVLALNVFNVFESIPPSVGYN